MPHHTRDEEVEAGVDTAAQRMERIEWLNAEAAAYARLNDQLERHQELQAAEHAPVRGGRPRLRLVATDDGAA